MIYRNDADVEYGVQTGGDVDNGADYIVVSIGACFDLICVNDDTGDFKTHSVGNVKS